ncbi:MAG: hypothetical protein ACEPOW_02640 [Bacteroidales bacterium]
MKNVVYALIGLVVLFIIPLFLFNFFFSGKEIQSKLNKKGSIDLIHKNEKELSSFNIFKEDTTSVTEIVECIIPYEKQNQVLYIDSLVYAKFFLQFDFFIEKQVIRSVVDSNKIMFKIRWKDKPSFLSISTKETDSVDRVFQKTMNQFGLTDKDFQITEQQQFIGVGRFSVYKKEDLN